jgi:hypothetical protein
MPPPIVLFDGRGGAGDGEGALTKLMEFERRVKEMHTQGQDPMGISNWIQSQLLPMANMTKAELQGEVNRAQQAVDACGATLASEEDGAREQEVTLSIGESRHNECELTQAQKRKRAEDDCQGVQALVESFSAPESVAEVDQNSTEAIEEALQQNYHFFEENYQRFMDEDTHCTNSQTLAEQQAQQCEADRSNLETSYCSLRGARQQVCSEYDRCFLERSALFGRVVDDVRQVEAHTKSTFKALTCFGRTVLRDMPGERPSCNASSVDTTYLDVFYPSNPSKEACTDSVSTGWNYSSSLCDAPESTAGPQSGISTSSAPSNSSGGNSSL